MLKQFNLLLCVCALTACASPVVTPVSEPIADIATTDTVQTERGLPPQRLAPNECGLFLWSKTDASKFVFFTRAGESDALFLLNDAPTKLRTLSEGGDIFGQFYTKMKFKTEAGLDVSLSYEAGEQLTDGARIKNGLMQYTDEKGWRTVLPVLGVRVCQPVFREELPPIPLTN